MIKVNKLNRTPNSEPNFVCNFSKTRVCRENLETLKMEEDEKNLEKKKEGEHRRSNQGGDDI
jgi:hypothetical protein